MPPRTTPTPIIPEPPTGAGETIPYLIKPGAFSFDDGLTHQNATLTFLVEDVTGAGPRVLMEALRAPQIPRKGDLFEGSATLIATNVHVTNIEDCTTKWEVTVTYGWPQVGGGPFDNPPTDQRNTTLELDSTVVMKRTNIDFNGDPIRIEGYHASVYDEDTGEPIGSQAKAEPIQGGMVDVPVVLTVLRFMRREFPVDSHQRTVAYKSKLFTGKTNSVDIDGSGVNTWLCTRLGGKSDDGGLTYNMTYEFAFDPALWRATAVYIDPKTGQPGDNLSIDDIHTMSGNGVKTFQIVGAADFHLLDLYL